jgi:hypothetical protein
MMVERQLTENIKIFARFARHMTLDNVETQSEELGLEELPLNPKYMAPMNYQVSRS